MNSNNDQAKIQVIGSGVLGVFGAIGIIAGVRSLAAGTTTGSAGLGLVASLVLAAYPCAVVLGLQRPSPRLRVLRSGLALGVVGVSVLLVIQAVLYAGAPSKYSDGTFPFMWLLGSVTLAALFVALVALIEVLQHARSRAA